MPRNGVLDAPSWLPVDALSTYQTMFAMLKVTVAVRETPFAAIANTDVAEASIVKVTVSPELAVAVTVYVGPWYTAADGAVDVKVMVCAFFTANDCWTCGAG